MAEAVKRWSMTADDDAPGGSESDPAPEDTQPPIYDSAEPTEDQPEADQGEPEVFTREYVQGLRDQAAAGRVATRRADQAEQRLREYAVRLWAGVLQDPSDLQYSDELNGEDGWPDPDRIKEAATALLAKKPHLGRPTGSVGQGVHSDQAESVDLAALLRSGA
jgi:hypothetical protein